MRSIKFRAWYRGTMYRYVEHCTYPDGSSGVNCIGYRKDGRMFSPGDDVELMQFTGLVDKNGKEVYEGDIVDWKIGEPPEGVYQVKWYEHGWYLERKDGFKEPLYPNLADGKGSSLEIIGNIHENSELIEGGES
jgi:uncharacterized phage protein (TIGR01671 family)